MPVVQSAGATSKGLEDDLKLTSTRLKRPDETTKMNETMGTVSEEYVHKSANATAAVKVMDSSPLKKEFRSKLELE